MMKIDTKRSLSSRRMHSHVHISTLATKNKKIMAACQLGEMPVVSSSWMVLRVSRLDILTGNILYTEAPSGSERKH